MEIVRNWAVQLGDTTNNLLLGGLSFASVIVKEQLASSGQTAERIGLIQGGRLIGKLLNLIEIDAVGTSLSESRDSELCLAFTRLETYREYLLNNLEEPITRDSVAL